MAVAEQQKDGKEKRDGQHGHIEILEYESLKVTEQGKTGARRRTEVLENSGGYLNRMSVSLF